MIFFIIGVVAALVALAVLLLSEEGKAAAFIPGVVAVIMIGVSCVSYVPTGYTGIVSKMAQRTLVLCSSHRGSLLSRWIIVFRK